MSLLRLYSVRYEYTIFYKTIIFKIILYKDHIRSELGLYAAHTSCNHL